MQGGFWKDRNLVRTDESLTVVILFVSFGVQMFAIVISNELPVLSRAAVCTDLDFFLTDPEDLVGAGTQPTAATAGAQEMQAQWEGLSRGPV